MLNLVVVFIDVLKAKIGNGNLSRHNFKVVTLGYFRSSFLFRGSGNMWVEFVFDFVVEPHAKHPPTSRFNLIADLVVGLWLGQAAFGFWRGVLQSLFEDHAFFLLFFRLQELDKRWLSHFLPLVFDKTHEFVKSRLCRVGRRKASD